jgi:hypothetical protein
MPSHMRLVLTCVLVTLAEHGARTGMPQIRLRLNEDGRRKTGLKRPTSPLAVRRRVWESVTVVCAMPWKPGTCADGHALPNRRTSERREF